MNLEDDLNEVIKKAKEHGIEWDNEVFKACFGKGTYRWLIEAMGIAYIEGMEIGLFDLHQKYDREDLEEL